MCTMEILPTDVAYFALNKATAACGLQQYQRRMATPTTAPEHAAFRKLLRQLYHNPKIDLRQVERIRAHLHRLFVLRTSDGTAFLLKCSPSRETRLLRHESRSLDTEGRILSMIESQGQVPVPRALHFDQSRDNAVRSPYLLRSWISGTTLADRLPYLSSSERADIDRSLGAYFHHLSQLRLDSFGTTSRVAAGEGKSLWSDAFQVLLESVLRDAEDVLVSLPYDAIRLFASRHRSALDEITEARLVPLGAGKADKVLLDDRQNQVVGLLGFSHVVWGDPQMAAVFASASEAFWTGFGGRPNNSSSYNIRYFLYYVYRSIVAITTQYHRPTADSDDLEARRVLTWALGQLGDL